RAVNRLPLSPHYGSAQFLLTRFFRGLPHAPEVRTQLLLGGLTAPEQARLFSPAISTALAGFDPYDELVQDRAEMLRLSPIEWLIYQHCKYYLAGQNLVTVDRASMACGLEVRAPFLDPALIELAGRMPSHLKLRGWQTKYILKRALRGLLPASVLARRKQGFGVPLGEWLRGLLRDALEERLSPERVSRIGLFDPVRTSQLVMEHLDGSQDHTKL